MQRYKEIIASSCTCMHTISHCVFLHLLLQQLLQFINAPVGTGRSGKRPGILLIIYTIHCVENRKLLSKERSSVVPIQVKFRGFYQFSLQTCSRLAKDERSTNSYTS